MGLAWLIKGYRGISRFACRVAYQPVTQHGDFRVLRLVRNLNLCKSDFGLSFESGCSSKDPPIQ